jgi:hypothetical protein
LVLNINFWPYFISYFHYSKNKNGTVRFCHSPTSVITHHYKSPWNQAVQKAVLNLILTRRSTVGTKGEKAKKRKVNRNASSATKQENSLSRSLPHRSSFHLSVPNTNHHSIILTRLSQSHPPPRRHVALNFVL